MFSNAIELIPPRSDDDADSPHFPMPPLEMMAGMSGLCADYGLDVWLWYPAMDDIVSVLHSGGEFMVLVLDHEERITFSSVTSDQEAE